MAAAAEPYSPPVRPERKPHWRDKLEVRRVVEADIEEMMAWVMPRIQKIYPRCTVDSVMPMIRLALAGGKLALLRTDNAVGLFCAETTPWEPDINVYQIFLVSRVRTDDESAAFRDASEANQFRTSLAGGLQPTAILQAAERWARSIGARTFQYGQDSGEDFDAFAEKVGYDVKTQGYVKILRE